MDACQSLESAGNGMLAQSFPLIVEVGEGFAELSGVDLVAPGWADQILMQLLAGLIDPRRLAVQQFEIRASRSGYNGAGRLDSGAVSHRRRDQCARSATADQYSSNASCRRSYAAAIHLSTCDCRAVCRTVSASYKRRAARSTRSSIEELGTATPPF